ncbi:Metallo-dependent phosphatase-like protein [Cristinia sonorae]|uniref:Double-strand break repair protein n=1 Tax=Cristinia sonorae TaxID=1940300 RepID=A0A8K0URR8_9AGAR|nr:Metallo-dependent phosphatase-like protein [Cristinia sonorae]
MDSDYEDTGPNPTMSDGNAFPEDTFRILLATDNHIGYGERDPVRGQDSINTFKEILQLAVKHDVDFVLLAGDLFHENRPSRDTLYQVTALLREYCLNDKPVQIELLSDPNEGKAAEFSFPAVNYEDPNLNVGMPVFSIHGNHDDPQGAGPKSSQQGALCALDMLSVSGLINYMGKIDLPVNDADALNTGIAVKPVLLRKGNSRLALYGIGNVKDQRLHFELRSNRVRMFMPKDKEDWFNILLLHQNRVPHGPHQSVPEGMFDDSIDLVVWGHEHDCRIEPEIVAGKRYRITQPGSSVATSLGDGESIEKHVGLLEICGKDYKLTPIPLRTVRPFVLDECSLDEAAEDEGLDLSDKMEISKYLKKRVDELINKANALWDERNARAVEEGEQEYPRMLPLIRLKVDTTGVSEMSNPVRFGQEFQGRIANPRDVLVFHRAKRSTRGANGKVVVEQPELSIDDPSLTVAEKLSKVRVQTLVQEYLAAQELQLLGEVGMSDAIEVFVDKDDIHAIQNHVALSLRSLMKGVSADETFEGEDDLEEIVEKVRERHEREYIEKQRGSKPTKAKGKARAEASDNESVDSMMMDVDGGGSDFEALDSDPPPAKKTTTRKAAAPAKKAPAKAPAKGRGKKAAPPSDDEEDDEEEEEEAPKPTKRTNRAATLSQTTTKKAPAKKAPAAKQSTLSFAPSGGRSTGTRAAATRAKKKTADVIDLDSD